MLTHGFAEINQQHVIELAARNVYPQCTVGGLVYRRRAHVVRTTSPVIIRRAASYVDRIFKGQERSISPLSSPLGWNSSSISKPPALSTSTLPPTLLARADEVINESPRVITLLGSAAVGGRFAVAGAGGDAAHWRSRWRLSRGGCIRRRGCAEVGPTAAVVEGRNVAVESLGRGSMMNSQRWRQKSSRSGP